jgi:protein involved in polysaccharide export with SLBB domain
LFFSGCADNVVLPTDQQLAEFEKAGPIKPEIDIDRLLASQSQIRDYRLHPGDLLDVIMPAILVRTASQIGPQTELNHTHITRVDRDGMITIPIVGKIRAAGLDLSEVESTIAAAYYPKYINQPPSIVVRITEHETQQVSVTGAVNNPGVYELPTHRMTLVSAIMAAGGIVNDGAAVIRINPPDRSAAVLYREKTEPAPLAELPSDSPTFPQSQVNISFQQLDQAGRGIVSIRREGKLLYAEELDVTSADQRAAVAANMQRAHPQIPSEHIYSSLCSLSELIRPGSGKCGGLPSASGASDVTVQSVASNDSLHEYLGEKQHQMMEGSVSGETGQNLSQRQPSDQNRPFLLPVKGLNIPFTDIALADRTSIIVEPLDPRVFTVIGLVKRAGAFPYPPNVQYNLLQALAFAGGVNETADPRYVRIYRRTGEDRIVDASFEIQGNMPTAAASMLIKPGDVVAVEQTQRTRTNLLLSQILRFNFGVMSYYDVSNND